MWAKVSAIALAGVVATAAGASQAQTLTIDDAVVRVIYRPENRSDFDVSVTGDGASGLPALRITRSGGDLRIDGGLGSGSRSVRVNRCSNGAGSGVPTTPGQGARVTLPRHGEIRLEDAPLVVVTGPRDARIRTSGAVHGTVARGSGNVDVGISGCGGWVLAHTPGKARISIGGSGTVWAGNADVADVNIGGSGRVYFGEVRDLDIAIGGSGLVDVVSVGGNADVAVSGSGNVKIKRGDIKKVEAAIVGSGNIEVGGTVGDLEARIMGAGNIEVERVTGNVSRRVVGVGRIRVND